MITHWTKDEEQYLLDQLKRGKPVQQIAKELNKTPSAVYHKKFKLGQSDGRRPHPVYSDEPLMEKAVELYYQGYTLRQIGDNLDITREMVSGIMQRKRVRKRRKFEITSMKGYDDELIEKVRVMFLEEKLSQRAIAKIIGIRYTVVRDICESRGFIRSAKWTADQYRTMVELLEKGESVAKISAVIGRGENGIITKAYSFNLHTRFPQINEARRIRNATRYSIDSLIRLRIKTSKRSATVRGLGFDIDFAYVKRIYQNQEGKCFYTGEMLTTASNDDTCLSIDRVDSSYGYMKGNIVLSGWHANRMKQDLPLSEYVRLCGVISDRWRSGAIASALERPVLAALESQVSDCAPESADTNKLPER